MLDLHRLLLLTEFAGTDAHREVSAVARTASVRRPSVSAVLDALGAAATALILSPGEG